jgi:SAM-dependent methyltransferase
MVPSASLGMDLRELPARTFDRHPWEAARADFFVGFLRDHLRTPATALDVGADDGYLARRLLGGLPGLARVTCFDPEYALEWLKRTPPGPPGLDFASPWPGGAFDLVLLLDVLEHAADDQALLARAVAHARPGGWLLLAVPAHPALFPHHDVLLGHWRRHAPAALKGLARAAGLELVAEGQLLTSLRLRRAPAKVAKGGQGGREPTPAVLHVQTSLGTWHHGPMDTHAARKVLALHARGPRLAARWGLPLPGPSAWVLAHRP